MKLQIIHQQKETIQKSDTFSRLVRPTAIIFPTLNGEQDCIQRRIVMVTFRTASCIFFLFMIISLTEKRKLMQYQLVYLQQS